MGERSGAKDDKPNQAHCSTFHQSPARRLPEQRKQSLREGLARSKAKSKEGLLRDQFCDV